MTPMQSSVVESVDTSQGKPRFQRMCMVIGVLLFGLSGCRQDYSLSPPAMG